MNCKEANQLDMISVLADLNYQSVRNTGDEYLYLAHYRGDNDPSLSVNRAKGLWYDHGSGMRGTLVDLIMIIIDTNDVSEVLQYCGDRYKANISSSFREQNIRKEQEGNLKEKKKAKYVITNTIQPIKNNRLKEYLISRGLSEATWSPYLEEVHYKNQHGQFYAIGFKNDSDGYEIRNALMKNTICLGKKDITTIIGRVDVVLMFEGFFDFLAHVELGNYDGESVIVLNSTTKILSGVSAVDNGYSQAMVKSFLDNDKAGNDATQILISAVDNVTDCSNLYSANKDVNEFLLRQIHLQSEREALDKKREAEKRRSLNIIKSNNSGLSR